MAGERQCLWFWMLRKAEREQELRRDKFFFKDIAGPVGSLSKFVKDDLHKDKRGDRQRSGRCKLLKLVCARRQQSSSVHERQKLPVNIFFSISS